MKTKIQRIALEMNKRALEQLKETLTQIDAVLLEYLDEYGIPYSLRKGDKWNLLSICNDRWGDIWKWDNKTGKSLNAVPVECRVEIQQVIPFRSKLINQIYKYQEEIRFCEYMLGLPFSDTDIQPEIER